jgi:hypothetical protein
LVERSVQGEIERGAHLTESVVVAGPASAGTG